jgi:hypothetical protein
MHRLALLALILPVTLLFLGGCKHDVGKTLTVDIPFDTNGAVVNDPVPVSAKVNYKGTLPLGFSWGVVSAPVGGSVLFSPGNATSGGAAPGTTITFGAPGTYRIHLDVFEEGGNISASDETTFVVVSGSSG